MVGEDRYLALLKRTLTRHGMGDHRHLASTPRNPAARVLKVVASALGYDLLPRLDDGDRARQEGRDQPLSAETMIGLDRLDHLERCVRTVVSEGVPGDLLEAGAWRGGACIFMRLLLDVLGDGERRVFVADSFQGLPRPSGRFAPDAGDRHWTMPQLAVSRAEVEEAFRRYGALDHRVVFLEGWFKDTLPVAPVDRLALLRLDGDMYESTWDALAALYDKVSTGGFVIVDDYALAPCRQAVDDFRRQRDVVAPIERVDWTAVCWRKA